MEGTIEAAIIGAGPYGLSAAAHLRAAGIEARVFGRTMSFWRRSMPAGMLLRSGWGASHIADPAGQLTLDTYAAGRGGDVANPIPLADFVDYGEWFRRRVVPDVDSRLIRSVGRDGEVFHLALEDGAELTARSVIVATGLEGFAWRPPQLEGLPPALVSHSSDHAGFSDFSGRRVTVLGGGQSAAESAALLHEAGASVELVMRGPRLHWLSAGRLGQHPNIRRLLYPPSEVGPPGLNWLVATPQLFRPLPRGVRDKVSIRVLRPAASDWLRPRLAEVRLTTSRTIAGADAGADRLRLTFDDGSRREVDHLLLATGYRVDVTRLPFLTDLAGSLRLVRGSPSLGPGFESSLPGLYFVGATATASFGPLMRFVAGTGAASRAVTASLRKRRPRRRS